MYFFNERLVQDALEHFKAGKFENPKEGDDFFGTFAPGNTADCPDRPYERFSDYEDLLIRLMTADPEKYRKMHKGTPFGFLSWLGFDMRNYEKAMFYMDTGIAEDIRKHKDTSDPTGWLGNPGPRFLMLDVDRDHGWFARTEDEVKKLLEQQLNRFNKVSNKSALTLDSWRSFTNKFLIDPDATQRSIISALYVFLLEFRDHEQELQLREGSTAGSNQPFTVHLLAGGLIFESLLKHCYPKPAGKKYYTLRDILTMPAFTNDFGDKCSVSISADTLADIHAAIRDSSIETAFATTGKLRNTTGHNLVWDNIFDSPKNYVILFEQEMNAILHVISQKLIERDPAPAPAGPTGPVATKASFATVMTYTGPGFTTSTSGPSTAAGGGGISGILPPGPGKK
jgi:hypothetical protein